MIPSLIDLLSRHQVYLEGLKQYQLLHFNGVIAQLNTLLRRMLSDLDYDTLDQFTKAKLNAFLRKLRHEQAKIWNAYTAEFIEFLEDFITVDAEVTNAIFEYKTDETVKEADKENDHNSLYGLLAALANKKGNERLWAIIKSEPIPANGMLPDVYLNDFSQRSQKEIEDTIRKAYANNWTIQDTMKAISGTPSLNHRDGLLQKIFRAANTVQSTIMQHTSSITNAAVSSVHAKRYRWVSVIDEKTSDICETRNQRIYYYDSGPQPPAHPNCRSRTVAILDDEGAEGAPPSYYVWVKSLPAALQNYILGDSQADLLRAGKLTAKEMGGFRRPKAIPLLDFKANVIEQLKGK